MEKTNRYSVSKISILNMYYSWLCDLIDVNQRDRSYWFLAEVLHNKDFSWTVPNDDNRGFEGKDLRDRFCDETDCPYIYDYFSNQCSMLELIIGLAYRCESIMVDQDLGVPMCDWFWRLLSNVGIDKFTDEDYYVLGGFHAVDEILNRVIERTYHRSGRGGLFPLKHPKKDQRKVELWYQMSAYLVENYYTEDAVV